MKEIEEKEIMDLIPLISRDELSKMYTKGQLSVLHNKIYGAYPQTSLTKDGILDIFINREYGLRRIQSFAVKN